MSARTDLIDALVQQGLARPAVVNVLEGIDRAGWLMVAPRPEYEPWCCQDGALCGEDCREPTLKRTIGYGAGGGVRD